MVSTWDQSYGLSRNERSGRWVLYDRRADGEYGTNTWKEHFDSTQELVEHLLSEPVLTLEDVHQWAMATGEAALVELAGEYRSKRARFEKRVRERPPIQQSGRSGLTDDQPLAVRVAGSAELAAGTETCTDGDQEQHDAGGEELHGDHVVADSAYLMWRGKTEFSGAGDSVNRDLRRACADREIDRVKECLEQGGDPNERDPDGRSCLLIVRHPEATWPKTKWYYMRREYQEMQRFWRSRAEAVDEIADLLCAAGALPDQDE